MMKFPHTPLWLITLACLSFLSTGCTTQRVVDSTKQFPPGTGFSKHTFVMDGQAQNVWVFVPIDYDFRTRQPAVLFLHGLFEAGHDGNQCLGGGLAPVIAEHPDNWKFITIFPQSDGNWRGEQHDRLAMAALDWAQQEYRIDQDRVILAGLSYGGLGTWEIGARHHDRFAALVPVSGHRAIDHVKDLLYLPIWAFSFTKDPWVDPKSAEDMCQQIDAQGGMAKLTRLQGEGHDGWKQAIDHSGLVQWMLKQHRTETHATAISMAAGMKTYAN